MLQNKCTIVIVDMYLSVKKFYVCLCASKVCSTIVYLFWAKFVFKFNIIIKFISFSFFEDFVI